MRNRYSDNTVGWWLLVSIDTDIDIERGNGCLQFVECPSWTKKSCSYKVNSFVLLDEHITGIICNYEGCILT